MADGVVHLVDNPDGGGANINLAAEIAAIRKLAKETVFLEDGAEGVDWLAEAVNGEDAGASPDRPPVELADADADDWLAREMG